MVAVEQEGRQSRGFDEDPRVQCASVARDAKHARIHSEGVASLVSGADPSSFAHATRSRGLPLRFGSPRELASWHCLRHALRFGSAFDADARSSNGRSVSDCVIFGLISMHLSGSPVGTAASLRQMNRGTLDMHMGISARVEGDVEGLGGAVTMARDGPLAPLADAMVRVAESAGAALDSWGLESLGELIERACNDSRIAGGDEAVDAESVAAWLTRRLPSCFGGDDPCHTKASALVADLAREIDAETEKPVFPFARTESLLCAADAELVAALIGQGVIGVTGAQLEEDLAKGTDLGGSDAERELRCLAVLACDQIAAALRARGGEFENARAVDADAYVRSLVVEQKGGSEGAARLNPRGPMSRKTTQY